MGFEWTTKPPQELFSEGVIAYDNAIKQALLELAESFAPRIEAWMKENAPWTDRTGNARQSLHTEVIALVNEISIWLFGGVDYQIFLELKNAGRYAIIGPALDYWAQQVWDAVRVLMS